MSNDPEERLADDEGLDPAGARTTDPWLLPVVRHGDLVAVCGVEGFDLAPRLAQAPPGDPELAFVRSMASFAVDVARGVVDGPYSDVAAARSARERLIPDALLAPEVPWSDPEIAAFVGIPPEEIGTARVERRRFRAR